MQPSSSILSQHGIRFITAAADTFVYNTTATSSIIAKVFTATDGAIMMIMGITHNNGL